MKTDLNHLIRTIVEGDALFSMAAKSWEDGNNSGTDEGRAAGESRCDAHRQEAECLLKPLGIEVDYPGLYPSFTFNGVPFNSLQSVVSASVGDIEIATEMQLKIRLNRFSCERRK